MLALDEDQWLWMSVQTLQYDEELRNSVNMNLLWSLALQRANRFRSSRHTFAVMHTSEGSSNILDRLHEILGYSLGLEWTLFLVGLFGKAQICVRFDQNTVRFNKQGWIIQTEEMLKCFWCKQESRWIYMTHLIYVGKYNSQGQKRAEYRFATNTLAKE